MTIFPRFILSLLKFNSRSTKELESQYKALEARLSKVEAERGDPIEICRRYKEVNQRFLNIGKIIDEHSNLLKVCMFVEMEKIVSNTLYI